MSGTEAQSSRMCVSVPHEVMINQYIFMIVENRRNQCLKLNSRVRSKCQTNDQVSDGTFGSVKSEQQYVKQTSFHLKNASA
jgi:hypothetical protein